MCKKWLAIPLGLVVMLLSLNSYAARKAGDSEISFAIPYVQGSEIAFNGGAKAELGKDHGFGFGYAYFLKPQLALRLDSSWNSAYYTAVRVSDDGDQQTYSNVYDSFNFSVGVDYYFLDGPLKPYVNANLGWNYLNSNIPAGLPTDVCWWDAWGYVCSTIRPTYSNSSWQYGVGAGIRFDITDSAYIQLGYQEKWFDIDHAKSTPSMDSILFEFGFKINAGAGELF